ncbi:MAG: PmoA family protein [Pirellulales bacterium]
MLPERVFVFLDDYPARRNRTARFRRAGRNGARRSPRDAARGEGRRHRHLGRWSHRRKQIWGTRDLWCDYSGTIDGRHVGITIMPHPKNPRPTWWHTRDYGVFVANGFGPRSVDKGAEPRLKVPAGESITFRYGVLVHDDPAGERPDLAAAYLRYTAAANATAPTGGGAAK